MECISVVGLDGNRVDADLSGATNVAALREHVAAAIGKPLVQVQLLDGLRALEDAEDLITVGSSVSVVVLMREPSWLPLDR